MEPSETLPGVPGIGDGLRPSARRMIMLGRRIDRYPLGVGSHSKLQRPRNLDSPEGYIFQEGNRPMKKLKELNNHGSGKWAWEDHVCWREGRNQLRQGVLPIRCDHPPLEPS